MIGSEKIGPDMTPFFREQLLARACAIGFALDGPAVFIGNWANAIDPLIDHVTRHAQVVFLTEGAREVGQFGVRRFDVSFEVHMQIIALIVEACQ